MTNAWVRPRVLILSLLLLAATPSPSRGGDEVRGSNSVDQERAADDSPAQRLPTSANAPDPEQPREVGTHACDKVEEPSAPNWITWFTGALVLVGFLQLCAMLVQAGYMYSAYDATRIAANAARDSAEAARTQLNLAYRPWVSVDVRLASGLQFSENGKAGITLELTVLNTGKTPAMHAEIAIEIITHGLRDPLKEQRKLCEPLRGYPPNPLKRTLLPNTPRTVRYTLQIDDVTDAFVAIPAGGAFTMPSVVGCVDYQLNFAEGHHQTGFIYQLVRFANRAPIPFQPMVDVPQAELALHRWLDVPPD